MPRSSRPASTVYAHRPVIPGSSKTALLSSPIARSYLDLQKLPYLHKSKRRLHLAFTLGLHCCVQQDMVCSEILACALVALALLASCAIATVGSSFDIQQISLDVNNASAVQDLVSELRPKLLPPPKAVPPKIGRMRPTTLPGFSPLRKGLLETRQSCTGNQNNYCFGNSQSYCANCGLCCIQSSGGWCCPPASSGFICCPAATANSGGGCCYDWQFCQSTGCVDPSWVLLIILAFAYKKTIEHETADQGIGLLSQ